MKKTTKMAVVLAAMSVMVLGAATMVSADEKNGWAKEGSDWYYYLEDEKLVNAWAQDSAGLWYFLGEDAKMLKETFVDVDVEEKDIQTADAEYDKIYYVGKDGAMLTNTWFEAAVADGTDGDTPYSKDGKDAWFYVGVNGQVYGNAWVLSDSNWYYVGINGVMVKNTLVDEYYLDGKGVMVTGWYKTTDKDTTFGKEGQWIYADSDGELVKADWKKVNSKWYYFGSVSGSSATLATPDYVMVEGDVIINETVKNGVESFILTGSGAMATGWIKYDFDGVRTTTEYAYAKADGILFHDVVEKIGNKYYYFGSDFVSVDKGYVVEADLDDSLTYFENEDDVVSVKDDVVYKLGSLVKTTTK